MNTQEFLNQMKEIQNQLLIFIESETDEKESYDDFVTLLENHKIQDNQYRLKSFLHLLSKITDHYHTKDFYSKIDQILLYIKKDIPKFFTNYEIFQIFKSNKRILLFLIEEQLLIINKSIAKIISNDQFRLSNYHLYFWPEIKSFLPQEETFELPQYFYINRKNGENEDYICQLIQKDLVEDFIAYTTKTNISLLNTKIKPSIYETNNFLLQNKPTLIEYSAFYGSIQIFRYLFMNNVELKPILWLYSIHSNNADIIHFLEEKKVKYMNECLLESIKCHHINITNFLLANYSKNEERDSESIFLPSLEFYNFNFIQDELIDQVMYFIGFCMFDYFIFVDSLLKTGDIVVKSKISSALVHAVEAENIEIVKLLLKCSKIDVNHSFVSKNHKKTIGKNALCAAVEKENIDIIKLLLENEKINPNIAMIEKDINTKSESIKEKTPLHIAIQNKNLEIIKLLLSLKSININAMYYHKIAFSITCFIEEKKSVLQYTIKYGNIEIIKLLLSYPKLDLNLSSKYLSDDIYQMTSTIETPLHFAIEHSHFEIVELLLSCKKIDINRQYNYRYYSKANDQINNFARFSEEEEEKTALHIAIQKENIEIIKLLFSNELLDCNLPLRCKRNDVTEFKTPLQIAVENENYDIVQLLMNCDKIDPNITGKLYFVYKDRDEDKEVEKTILHTAIEKDNIDIFQLLISYDSLDVNQTSFYKYYKKHFSFVHQIITEMTPLYIAINDFNLKIIEVLLSSKNIDVNTKSRLKKIVPKEKNIIKEETALNLAIEKQNMSIIQLLLSCKNIDLKAISKYKFDKNAEQEKTPFILAVQAGNNEIINLLNSV
ncbi:hypothetical protein M9Y10_037314 [Tritrichomonas musculus]|uniref:DUF3447 domain-containing protein n=1 Tax=Tritrichomonas musculus TaxID=1915356 RepID=A0ABR2GTX1_9EUKA